ncbi:Sugar porter (SP) family MFS transporter [Fusarium keratoplasticum]|uniref:Sugar porter (SP) family MFS transporter n=1 Tax=Fusarium keratoplasticum TaxID=1328300 RepID=A0ACC0QBG7_9HYPO|nr:Sugar porter (SP) family MFS transporter [Fusarium keratoplasticum]KAI8649251.1 Sugar porter (SP) family MFS transporter [Fusarium keratoplasticum]
MAKDTETAGAVQPVNPYGIDDAMLQDAHAAGEAERDLKLWASLKLYPKAVGWSILLSTVIIMEGFDTVLIGTLYAYPPFQRDFGIKQADGSYQLTAAWQSGLSNGILVGEIFGLYICGFISERYGYRWTLIGALIAVIGFVFIVFFAGSLVQLLIGEILLGVPWGIFQTLTTQYASEVCPTHLRAYLTTYVNLCWVMGQLIASGVLRAMLSRNDIWGYRIPFALQWMWPVPLIVGIFLAPESPWWLVRKGKLGEAKRSLLRLTTSVQQADQQTSVVDGQGRAAPSTVPGFDVDKTISMMVYTNEVEKAETEGTGYLDLFRGSVSRRRTEIVCATWLVQQLCGTSLQAFSTYFYQNAGLDVSNSFNLSLGQYGIGFFGTIGSWFFVSKFGRRDLYLFGQIGLTLVLFSIGCTTFSGKTSASQWAAGSLLLGHALVYNLSVGPVCYSLVSEIPSTRLRGKAIVLARNTYNVGGIVINIITPRMVNPSAWNWGARAGFFWAGLCLLCAIWTYFRLPEPKGRTFLELDILFENHVSARNFSKTQVDTILRNVEHEAKTDKLGPTATHVG